MPPTTRASASAPSQSSLASPLRATRRHPGAAASTSSEPLAPPPPAGRVSSAYGTFTIRACDCLYAIIPPHFLDPSSEEYQARSRQPGPSSSSAPPDPPPPPASYVTGVAYSQDHEAAIDAYDAQSRRLAALAQGSLTARPFQLHPSARPACLAASERYRALHHGVGIFRPLGTPAMVVLGQTEARQVSRCWDTAGAFYLSPTEEVGPHAVAISPHGIYHRYTCIECT